VAAWPNLLFLLRLWTVRHAQANKGMTPEFEHHVRCLMATGATARQTRESLLLSAGHFLGAVEGAAYCGGGSAAGLVCNAA
jgi:hypothetical protein